MIMSDSGITVIPIDNNNNQKQNETPLNPVNSIVENVYFKFKETAPKTISSNNLVAIVTQLMLLLETTTLDGASKKAGLLLLINRFIDANAMSLSIEELNLLKSAVTFIVPAVIDTIVKAVNGDLAINVRSFCEKYFPSCCPCFK